VPVTPTPSTVTLGDNAPFSSTNAPPSSHDMDCTPVPRDLLPRFQSAVVGSVASGSGDVQQPYGQCSNDALEQALFGEIFGDDTDTETLIMGGGITVKVTADSLEVTKANNDDAATCRIGDVTGKVGANNLDDTKVHDAGGNADSGPGPGPGPGPGNAATGSTGDMSGNVSAAGPDDHSAKDKGDAAVANGSTGDVNGKHNSEKPGDMKADAPSDDITFNATTTNLDDKIDKGKDHAAVANGSTSDVNGGVAVNVNTGIRSRGQWIADGITVNVTTENGDANIAKDSDDAANGSSSTADVNAKVTTCVVDDNAPAPHLCVTKTDIGGRKSQCLIA
jgi:hypothetical protein